MKCPIHSDPRILLDPLWSKGHSSNATEKGLRRGVLGRKNHYGPRSRRGTEFAALFYSLIQSAKVAEVDPYRCLREAAIAALREQAVLLPPQLAV